MGPTFEAFAPSRLFVGQGAMAAVLVIVVTAFIGFEATPVFAEESRDSERTIQAATFATLFLMIAIYVVSTWAITVATGPATVVLESATALDQLMFNLAGPRLGAGFADAGTLLLITSSFAAMLSFHHNLRPLHFALAREGVLPRGLAHTGARSGAPQTASALQSSLALIVIIVYAITDLHPVNQLLYWVGRSAGSASSLCSSPPASRSSATSSRTPAATHLPSRRQHSRTRPHDRRAARHRSRCR